MRSAGCVVELVQSQILGGGKVTRLLLLLEHHYFSSRAIWTRISWYQYHNIVYEHHNSPDELV
jgi:hypothetical protein